MFADSIYTLEKKTVQGQAHGDTEHTVLIDRSDPDTIYTQALDNELQKISEFYAKKEKELFLEVTGLSKDAQKFTEGWSPDMNLSDSSMLESRDRRRSSAEIDGDEDDSDDEARGNGDRETLLSRPPLGSHTSTGPRRRPRASSQSSQQSFRRRLSNAFSGENDDDELRNELYDIKVTLKKRAISLFVALRELRSFSQLNRTGFRKALKKYDKIMDRTLKDRYLKQKVDPSYCFSESTIKVLDREIAKVVEIYADIVTSGDSDAAMRDLRLHLREHVVWERNTVWREMIGIERKTNAAHMSLEGTLLSGDAKKLQLAGDPDEAIKPTTATIRTPFGRFTIPSWIVSTSFFTLLVILGIFFFLIHGITLFPQVEQSNCFAMLVLVSLLWATEIIPLFVTSLLIPFLCVILRIVRSDQAPYTRLAPKEATKYIFSAMWTPVIILLLGGFSLAAALSKYGIAKRLATFVLSKAGTRPRTVLLANMAVAMFGSMWISNVAAPVLCYGIVQPILRNLPADSDFSKALILGIALASNVGGMASPIASPQNLVALENMKPPPSWGGWFFVALPVCVVSILSIWILLLVTFKISGKDTIIVPVRAQKDPFRPVEWFIIAVTLFTIGLWCASHQLENVFGDMGVIAIIPLVLFFGTGVLSKEDFNNFLWTIIILAAGGLSLGKAVSSSGLLHEIAGGITTRIDGYGFYSVLLILCSLILVVATFISHTVAALIVLPVVAQVGRGMEGGHPNLLVMVSQKSFHLYCASLMDH